MHTNVNVLADQRSLSILTVNLSFIVRAGAGRQKQCVVLSVCASLWRNRHAYCFALCTVSVTYMHSRFCSLAQHACLLFRSPYCQCHTHASLVLLPRATHMLFRSLYCQCHTHASLVLLPRATHMLFRSLYCQCHTHASLVLMPRATHMLTVLLSVPSESRTCLIGSTVYSNTHACCYALCTVKSLWRNTNAYCFRSTLSASDIHSQLVLLSGASHVLTVSALCTVCVTCVHSWFCLSGTTSMLTVSLSILLESQTFIVGSALWHNPNAYCFPLYAVSVTYDHSPFSSLVQHPCLLFRSLYCLLVGSAVWCNTCEQL